MQIPMSSSQLCFQPLSLSRAHHVELSQISLCFRGQQEVKELVDHGPRSEVVIGHAHVGLVAMQLAFELAHRPLAVNSSLNF